MTHFNMSGYVRLYRSMLRFINGMSADEAAKRVYTLYTANTESYRCYRPCSGLTEISENDFYSNLTNWKRKPYRTIVQLYRAMEALCLNIDTKVIAMERLFALCGLCSLMDDIETRFRKAFFMEIHDKRTVYALCKRSLTPRKDEPGVCLVKDITDL
jgi:hypothetical protein